MIIYLDSPQYTKSLVRTVYIVVFFTIPKYLVYAVYPIFDRVNPSFVRKIVMMCIIDFIGAFLVSANYF